MRPSTTQSQLVSCYDSHSEQYHDAFQVFLSHTDQKDRLRQWLDRLVDSLRVRRVFIDAGAGTGKVTEWYLPRFDRAVAFDPNPLHVVDLTKLAERFPGRLAVLEGNVLTVTPPASGDFILASHVFYYIDESEWMVNLERLASWLSPEGVLVIVLQNHETDCMRMLDHFVGRRYNLATLEERFRQGAGRDYDVALRRVDAHITTSSLEAAYTIAEFMLNLTPLASPPPRADLERYVRTRFAGPGGEYRFSCHQDCLTIRHR